MFPSVQPTSGPTSSPTTSPPTVHVKSTPTGQGTESPSAAPSNAEQVNIVNTDTSFSPYVGSGILSTQAQRAFARETESQIRQHILQAASDVNGLVVDVKVISQTPPTAPSNGSGGRSLQNSLVPQPTLVIRSRVSVIFRSNSTHHDVKSWVFTAFDHQAQQSAYIDNLKHVSSEFDGVKNAMVKVEGYSGSVSGATAPQPSNPKNSHVAVIAGASVGGAAAILLAVFLLIRLGSDRSVDEGHQQSQTGETSGQHKVST